MKQLQNVYRFVVAIGVHHSLVAVLMFIFCLTQLSGCGVISNKQFAQYDGPPAVDIDVTKIKDAVPKVEPLHPYGTRDYVIRGHHYHVLKSSKGYVKKGYASWYGSSWHGKKTATQEQYNMYAMTAASPELPLPSYVQVTNLLNGKTVVVRVNDRGPHVPGSNRFLDVSYAAAKKLDFVNRGVVPVKIVAINPKTWGKAIDTNVHTPKYSHYAKVDSNQKTLVQPKHANLKLVFLQVGAFARLDNAKQLSSKVNALVDKPVRIEHKSDLYRVHVGPLASSSQCDQLRSLLKQNGFEHVTIVGG